MCVLLISATAQMMGNDLRVVASIVQAPGVPLRTTTRVWSGQEVEAIVIVEALNAGKLLKDKVKKFLAL